MIDMHEKLRKHMDATKRRDEWAQKGLDFVKAGKMREAIQARQTAEYWDRRVRKLEERPKGPY